MFYNTLCFNIKILLTKNKRKFAAKNKIKEDLDSANKFKEQSEVKVKEYEAILEKAKEVAKIHLSQKYFRQRHLFKKVEIEKLKRKLKAQTKLLNLKKTLYLQFRVFLKKYLQKL